MAEAELAAALMRGLMKLGRRVRSAPQDASRAGDVSLSAVSILGALRRKGPMAGARLAEEQRLQPQSLSRLIADLDRRKLIARTRDADDARVLLLSITPAGMEVLRDEMRARRVWLGAALAELTPGERATLKQAAALMERLAGWESADDVLDL